MQLEEDFNFYCQRLGREIHPSNWNRLVSALGLAGMGAVDRRVWLKAVADIRRVKPKAKACPQMIETYIMLRSLEDAAEEGEMEGAQIIRLVRSIRPVTPRTIFNWGSRYGLTLAATRVYRGQDLKLWIRAIARNIPAVRQVREDFIEV